MGFRKYLLDIAVKEVERRRRIGTSLLKTLVERFKQKNVISIRLELILAPKNFPLISELFFWRL
ncbi:hypothetical protein AKJ41_05950 [candidate division MSBL1 archaeon SCGC-AAA259O05]|uniref:N-acetyltransferase domain-containing protein n=1 Tax=candidate division MSBL1 archaeon SCGC-AAA259O05 TaxID=1698271 RepID=A0A133UY59_9EURY|nr:hypothetical protein AKJ41_05950 [candidate division MSBL1 archaeon SCGC-AAA259O05]